MSELFVPLLDPPDEPGGPGLWFVVHRNTVAIREASSADELGVPTDTPHFLGTLDGVHCWGCAIDEPGDALDEGEFVNLHALYGRVSDRRWFLAGRAVQIVEWDRTHRFCGRCGAATDTAPGERAKKCPSCGLLAFPRLAPAVITVVHREGEVLLARGRAFGGLNMYSALAGFVEPGESLEEAVHREVGEEVGVQLAGVRYWGSQPWPFPHQLMIGFLAEYGGGDIVIQESEIVDAQWFRVDDLPMIPPPMSIARRLIDAVVAGER